MAEFETSSRQKAVTNGNRSYRKTFNKIVRKSSNRIRFYDAVPSTDWRPGRRSPLATGYGLDGPGCESWCG